MDAAQAETVWESGDRSYRVRDSGLDACEFLLAAGPAEPLRPLAAVASGGESARIMMALKAAPAAAAAAARTAAGARRHALLLRCGHVSLCCRTGLHFGLERLQRSFAAQLSLKWTPRVF